MEALATIESRELAAAEIERLHREAELQSEAATVAAFDAIKLLVECGDLLTEQREELQGEFDLWCGASLSFPVERARKVMEVAKRYGDAIRSGQLDHQACKQLYLAIDHMPEPDPAPHAVRGDSFSSFWSMTVKLDRWLPRVSERDKPRLREWWTAMGKRFQWIP